MDGSVNRWALSALSGEDRSGWAMMLRGGLSVVEPAYAALMTARNAGYRHGLLQTRKLPRPTVSVGNITTGGTGKTPVVRWLAEQLIARGLRPAVLLRGYRGGAAGGSDEQLMLAESLGGRAAVVANADRVAGAMSTMTALPQPDVFLLDDGFQHRRAGRDFDLVLIDVTEPFGFGHVLPRGLLREPMRGLARAHAVLITRSDQVPPTQLQSVQAKVRRWVPATSIFFAKHVHGGLRSAKSGGGDATDLPMQELSQRRFFAFAGIANPQALQQQLSEFAGRCVGFREFADHHSYTARELADLQREAAQAGAAALLTTEKDWVKIRSLPMTEALPVWRLDLRVEFHENDGERLLNQVLAAIHRRHGGLPNMTALDRS